MTLARRAAQVASGMLLLAAVPGFLFPAAGRWWLLLALPVFLALSRWAGPHPAGTWGSALEVTPFNLPILLLAVMLLVSAWATYDLSVSLGKICGVLLGVLSFFYTARLAGRPAGWLGVLVFFCLLGLGVALVGLVSTVWFTEKVSFLNRYTRHLPFLDFGLEQSVHPNELAGALLWVLPVSCAGVAIAWHLRRRAARWLGVIFFASSSLLMAGVLLLAQSRGAYLAIGVTFAGMALLALPRRIRCISLAAGLGAALSGLGWLGKNGFLALFAAAGRELFAHSPALSLATLQARVALWSQAIWLIQDAPLTGIGMNVFRKAVFWIYPSYSLNPNFDLAHAHNELLQVALDLGLPGLVAFLSLYLVAFAILFSARAKVGKAPLLALGGGLAAHFLYGLTDAVALGAKPGLLFWMLLGLTAGLYRWAGRPDDA